MKKLTQKEIEKKAERIREEYAYMDDIPLEGWIWEFIRRSPKYKEFFEKFRNLSLKKNLILGEIHSLFDEYGEIPMEHYSVDHFYHRLDNSDDPRAFLEGIDQMIVSFSEDRLGEDHAHALPDYRIPYNDFALYEGNDWTDTLDPIRIQGLDPYQIMNGDWWYGDWSTLAKAYEVESLDKLNLIDDDMNDEDILYYMGMSTSKGLEQNIYVRISTNASERDLKNLLQEIKPYLTEKKRRVRDKKWKYYLIVYDLREEHNYTYTDIANILCLCFPGGKEVYDETNILYHYNKAIQLIDKGDYREYLHYGDL